MSRHWDPRIVPGSRRTRRLPAGWKQYRRPWWRRIPRIRAREVLLAMLAGVLLGLAAAIVPWSGLAPDFAQEAALPQAVVNEAGRAEPAAVRVIDGDTFDYRGMRVRIADIDTPEVDGRCAYETELAARATHRMRALLEAGPFELNRLPNGRDEDRYGRKLRIVTRDGRSLGDQLVSEGLARTWTGRREPWC